VGRTKAAFVALAPYLLKLNRGSKDGVRPKSLAAFL